MDGDIDGAYDEMVRNLVKQKVMQSGPPQGYPQDPVDKKRAPEWRRKAEVMVKQIAPGVEITQRLEPPKVRFTDPDNKDNYVELGWKDGVFTVTSNTPTDQMDDTARAFLGTIIAQMNRVLPR